MTDAAGATRAKQLTVFAIIERKDTTKPPYWMKIGAAFTNRDGSLTVYLDAFPIGTNKLQVREARPWDEPRSAARAAPDAEAQP